MKMNSLLRSGLKKSLIQMERMAPQLTSRAWGLWEKPLAEIQGIKITKLTEFHAEVTRKPWSPWTQGGSGDFLMAGEIAVRTLWKRHTLLNEELVLKKCSCEFYRETSGEAFVGRTELLENDRESILRGARMGVAKEFESMVLFFDSGDKLIAQAQYEYVFKGSNNRVLVQGES